MSASSLHTILPRQSTSANSPNTGSATGDQLLKLVSNPFQAALQTNAFWASLVTYLGLSAFLALLFSLVRPRHRLVYAPKTKHADEKHAPPPMGNGLLSWIGPVSKAKENVLMDKIGMDAIIFLRFTRMLRNMFAVLGLIGLCIMIPVNVTQGADISGGSGFAIMTPLFVFGNGLWAQVVVAWASNIIIAYFLWHNYRRILQLRRAYFENSEYQASLHSRTILVRDLSPQLRNDEGLVRVTDEVNPAGVTPRVSIGRNVRDLPDLIEEHEEAVRTLESVLAKYLKNPDRLPPNRPLMKPKRSYKGLTTNGKVDAIEYLTERIRELETQIHDVREQLDKRNAEAYGFASWEQISQAHSVTFAARKKSPQGTRIQLAPRPNDLIWKNLPLTKASRKAKRVQNAIWIALLTLIWLPLNAAIAIFLSNLSNLGSVWDGFRRQLEAHPTGWAIVQGIASPAITSLVYLVLPIIFRRLQVRAGDYTKTQREQHVLRNLYTFFTLNNLIIFSIFSAVWQFVTNVIQNNQGDVSTWDAIKKADFFLTLTTSLCQISPFWVTFLLQRNLGAATDLVQLWKLVAIWFERTFMAPTPRQNIEWTAPPPFEYASYYNYFLFYTTIALCFSTLQPLILIVTALYFAFDSVLKKYLLMYVFVTKTESGGQFWRTLFNRLIFATILSDIIIGVVVKARGTWAMVAAIAPLLFLIAGFKWYCSKTFDFDIKYYARTGMHDEERPAVNDKRAKTEKITSKFGHPALYKPLMAPMVHAKARHILADIYRGRLGSETENTGFSDIAMQPMNAAGHKPSESSPFEFVSDAQQDFAYYKNRDDFKGEGGDIYGVPEDMMTERSQTPMSFMSYGKHGRGDETPHSGETSREQSPAPVLDPKRTSQIRRKELADVAHVHPAFRSGRSTPQPVLEKPTGDLSVKQGLYTDPDDDRQTLLGGLGNARTPNGEFMSMDRWRAAQSGPMTPGTNNSYDKDPAGSYDYFRGRQ